MSFRTAGRGNEKLVSRPCTTYCVNRDVVLFVVINVHCLRYPLTKYVIHCNQLQQKINSWLYTVHLCHTTLLAWHGLYFNFQNAWSYLIEVVLYNYYEIYSVYIT